MEEESTKLFLQSSTTPFTNWKNPIEYTKKDRYSLLTWSLFSAKVMQRSPIQIVLI